LIKGAFVELEIESIASGGDAFSRIDGLAVFADRGLPGDRVRGTVSRKNKSFARVAVSEILAPSSDAVLPACEVSEICGGCRFWRAAYPDELRWKVEATRDAIERLARDVSWPAHQVIASVSDRGYRHRARFRMGPAGEVGFLRERSDEVVEGPGCPVLHPSLEGIRPTVRALFSGVAGLQSIFVEFDEVREGVAITAEFAERDLPHVLRTVRTRLERLKPLHDVTTVVVLAKRRPTAVVGDGSVWRRRCVGSERLIVKEPTAGFSQANARTNRLLVDVVASSIPESSTGSALELFGGAGNLTFPLVSRGYEVDSIDIADGGIHAAAAAWRGWDARPPRRIRFHAADLEGGLPPEVIPQAREVSVIVADPPRGGLSAALVEDLRLAVRARTFVYVSCDPPAMARDVSRLADQGWLPERVTFVDMFPKTPHMEAVVSLRRG
jgi:23S rRNA (uracil1939-C5)-methyltransferase